MKERHPRCSPGQRNLVGGGEGVFPHLIGCGKEERTGEWDKEQLGIMQWYCKAKGRFGGQKTLE